MLIRGQHLTLAMAAFPRVRADTVRRLDRKQRFIAVYRVERREGAF